MKKYGKKRHPPKQNQKQKPTKKKASPNNIPKNNLNIFCQIIHPPPKKKTTSLVPTIFFDSLSLQKFQRTKAAEVRHLITNLYSAPWLSVTDLGLLVGDGV